MTQLSQLTRQERGEVSQLSQLTREEKIEKECKTKEDQTNRNKTSKEGFTNNDGSQDDKNEFLEESVQEKEPICLCC